MESSDLKIKNMTREELILAIDRLTRFKAPEIKFNRVYKELIAKYLISPKISFKTYDTLDENEICLIVEQIFKKSLCDIGFTLTKKDTLQKIIVETENKIYTIDEQTKTLMNAKIPYDSIVSLCGEEKSCLNLKLLTKIIEDKKNLTPEKLRNKFFTKFPIKKVVLAEGITEEILLPKFAKILGYDFDKYGVEVIAAGGKNQVAKEYLKLLRQLKIPIVILLDADAKSIAEKISDKLREQDKLILIEKGEFEDILPLKLIKKAINYKYKNLFQTTVEDFAKTDRVKDLEEIYRINRLGEFKKAEFAHNVDEVLDLKSKNFVSEEIENIIEEIKTLG